MNPQLRQNFKSQLEAVLAVYHKLVEDSRFDDLSGVSDQQQCQRVITLARAAIQRVGGAGSAYAEQAQFVLTETATHDGYRVIGLAGIVDALIADLDAGYLQSVEQLIHGEVFGDFLEMSSHLLDEGYKDAAAVISGSALEAHLRQLCQRNNIDVEVPSASGLRPKKADQMNANLAKAKVYSKLDQKNVTAWLDLRNKAAHGNYDEYSAEQVKLMTDAVRDFITRNPA